MQFTGLRDFNDKESCQGNIYKDNPSGKVVGDNIYVMEWVEDEAKFVLSGVLEEDTKDAFHVMNMIEIGNIHQNPELV